MQASDFLLQHSENQPDVLASELTIAQLVGQVYDAAAGTLQTRMVEHLMHPLGAFTVVLLRHGIFARAWLRSEWLHTQVRLEDVSGVRATDMAVLVDRVQQISAETVDGVALVLAGSPMLESSAPAKVLLAILVQRCRVTATG